jgi:hypothetical protein
MYNLTLTENDFSAICFSGGRYQWSREILFYLEPGENEIPEGMAWELVEAFEEDTKGGHSLFPLLASDSRLYEKLIEFMDSIV